MAKKMQGTIGKFRKDRKAFEIDDEWYSAYRSSWMGEAKSGDTVEFEYVQKGDFNNIEKDTLKVLDSAPKSSGGGSGKGGGYQKKGGEFRSVPQLVRQEAVSQAEALLDKQGFKYDSPRTAVKAVLYVANVIAAYVDGHIDMDGQQCPDHLDGVPVPAAHTKAEVKHQPVPDPEPEPESEPEKVESPAPSLDEFLG